QQKWTKGTGDQANGNGGTPSPNLAAAAQVLAERNAKPHVWSEFAKKYGVSVDDLKGYAKAVGTGLETAAIGAAGLPGDIKSGVDWLMNKALPMTPEQQAQYAGANTLTPPTSADLLQGAKNIGEPLHKAQTHTARA